MKKRLFALTLCIALLLSTSTIGASAESVTAKADSLFYTLSYGTTDGKTLSDLTPLNAEEIASYSDNRAFTLNSSTGLLCQLFDVDVAGVTAERITLNVGASTLENERVALKVFNVNTGKWDTVDTAVSAGTLQADVALADYAKDGKVQAMVTLDFVANGSNRLLWSTDQQHYVKHDDLNEFYFKIHEYMVKEYQADNAVYVINTGDIVDDTPGMATAAKQWKTASEAFEILDDAGVPYGIVTGNHDVGDYPTNMYTRYLQYFNKERYENNPWYGGTPDDNKCHYDLVTVGNYDFLFMYFGYGQGAETEVIEWANEVLAMYPHRNAVLCTHQYLKPTTLTQEGRAEIIHNAIVTQNPNVKMVLSGHYDGAGYKWRDADGRQVLEVISDYQFVQAESEDYYADHVDPLHHIGSVANCNGEGYIREILVNGNTIDMYAFSPVTGGKTPFGARDDLRFTVELQSSERTLTTFGFTASTEPTASVEMNAEEGLNIICDAPALNKLIEKANTVEKSLYTKDSYKAMKAALKDAKKAMKNSDVLSKEYVALNTAIGALEEDTLVMDRDKLETVLDFNLQLPVWQNTEGAKSFDKVQSYIKAEQLENGGFTVKKSDFSKNNWPAMRYIEPITITPKDGKVYLYLDVEAGSTWSLFPTIIQDMQQYSGRLNYIIEGSYGKEMDAGSGIYKGVYDITQALVDMGVDPTKEMTMTFVMNVVPGPVTVNELSILTGAYSEGFSLNHGTDTMWYVLLAVVVLGGGVIIFALLYTPKKKEDAKEETTDTDIEE